MALAGICVVLAVAVAREHRRAACWETAVEFELAPGADCADHDYARALQARHGP
ncbi:MAG: hypothetical protein KKE02_24255 [Alphaproteobacteria bacterium]|nr:hypothetical protein [Alphaproteobacteria bacterium]MBU1516514.1 hypothetical protein [Alphaproteobacteria bacterium]MBU2094271.1 hypothetical protein [Alphaproteobacteria bacterium]MBU2154152.1 hypothetical protein [Alphaproteobacteria bacterium]MBU2307441.1 hypothetical protein [Alphaproteobacteria bacterium]